MTSFGFTLTFVVLAFTSCLSQYLGKDTGYPIYNTPYRNYQFKDFLKDFLRTQINSESRPNDNYNKPAYRSSINALKYPNQRKKEPGQGTMNPAYPNEEVGYIPYPSRRIKNPNRLAYRPAIKTPEYSNQEISDPAHPNQEINSLGYPNQEITRLPNLGDQNRPIFRSLLNNPEGLKELISWSFDLGSPNYPWNYPESPNCSQLCSKQQPICAILNNGRSIHTLPNEACMKACYTNFHKMTEGSCEELFG